jgi:hypothetical protein
MVEPEDIESTHIVRYLSGPLRREGTMVNVVNENVPTQFSISFYNAPTSATGIIIIVVSLP